MNTEQETRPSGSQQDTTTVPPPGTDQGDLNQRGGRIDIEQTKGKVEEALEETFPASDAPSHTPPGYIDAPPPFRN